MFFIHSQKEHGEHDNHHADGGKGYVAGLLKQEESRDANQRTGSKAKKLPFCQIE